VEPLTLGHAPYVMSGHEEEVLLILGAVESLHRAQLNGRQLIVPTRCLRKSVRRVQPTAYGPYLALSGVGSEMSLSSLTALPPGRGGPHSASSFVLFHQRFDTCAQ